MYARFNSFSLKCDVRSYIGERRRWIDAPTKHAAHRAKFAPSSQEIMPFSLSGASQTPMRARGRFILLSAGELGGHT